MTPKHLPAMTLPPLQKSRLVRWIAAVTTMLLLATLVGCTSGSDEGVVDDEASALRPVERPGFLLSYAAAADRLEGMDELEREEQLRAWVRFGLAADLELETETLVENAYDTLPVRDEGFADLARQPVGPGRSLFADGVLHLLVPHEENDPHWVRTVGLLLDQHRTDAGDDPEEVRLHRYTVHEGIESIEVVSDDPVATEDFRAANGYVEMRIDTPEDLEEFLDSTRALSTVEVVGDEVWAGGWEWAEGDGERLTREDVAVLQRGYDLAAGGEPTPGFSLDPSLPATEEDLAAIAPDILPELFGIPDELEIVTEAALFGDLTEAEASDVGLPTDRTQLWALWNFLLGDWTHSEARYEGGLEGTEVGMTLFYTDKVAKDWVAGVGEGVPTDEVEGFEPVTEAGTAWSHCETAESADESGRLWFGQNDAAYSLHTDRISIGERPTRLFAVSDGEDGVEVERSYMFGRGMRWWDANYPAVADYEPQYQRLDQIMRWSAALDWLGEHTAELPPYSDVDIRGDLRFSEWYRDNGDLRERGRIRPVTLPSAPEVEAVLTVPSDAYENCGLEFIQGGVSLPDFTGRRHLDANLPEPMRRARPTDPGATTVDPAARTGTLRHTEVDGTGTEVGFRSYEITPAGGGARQVDLTANQRRVIPFGPDGLLKVWRDVNEPRSVTTTLDAGGGEVAHQVRYYGQDFGGLTAVKQGEMVSLTWRNGPVERVRVALESLRERLRRNPNNEPLDGVLYRSQDARGGDVYGIGDELAMRISEDAPTLTAEPAFRLGVEGPEGPRNFYATMGDLPPPTGRILEVIPATAETASSLQAAAESAPPRGARVVEVVQRDGPEGRLYLDGDRVLVEANDPVVGENGTTAGLALRREWSRVQDTMRDALDDGLWRAFDFGGDGAALARGGDRIVLADTGDPVAVKVAQLTAADPARTPLFGMAGDVPVSQAKIPLEVLSETPQRRLLGGVLNEDATVLISDRLYESLRATDALDHGPVFMEMLPRDLEVNAFEARVTGERVRTDTPAQPDVWESDGGKWWRVSGGYSSAGGEGGGDDPGDLDEPEEGGGPDGDTSPDADIDGGPGGGSGGDTGSQPTPAPSADQPAPILLVCAQDDEECAA